MSIHCHENHCKGQFEKLTFSQITVMEVYVLTGNLVYIKMNGSSADTSLVLAYMYFTV